MASPSVAPPFDAGLSADTRLQLAPGIRTRLNAVGHVLVDAPDGTVVDVGPHGFTILSLFACPVALGDAVGRLEAGLSASAFVPALSVVNILMEEGALVSPGASHGPSRGWADPVEHARMLHDDRRTGAYISALAQAVRPGDIVLDIGTGSGVLAIAAARAGARRVYAVEASDIAAVAEQVIVANGLADRVTVIAGWSRQTELPEPADLLVSEIIGNEPFEEEILETTLDARLRLLKPSARLVPQALTLLARPLLIPEAEARQRFVGRAAVERWRQLYDMDFQPLLSVANPLPVNEPTEAEVVAGWSPIGPPQLLARVDLASFATPMVSGEADLVTDTGGSVNAIAVTFRADLHGTIAHTLDPWRWPTSSWATSVWTLPEPMYVRPRDALRVRYSRRVAGVADGLTCALVERVEN